VVVSNFPNPEKISTDAIGASVNLSKTVPETSDCPNDKRFESTNK
jgi:hypothetical protein